MKELAHLNIFSIVENPSEPKDDDDDEEKDRVKEAHDDGHGSGNQKD